MTSVQARRAAMTGPGRPVGGSDQKKSAIVAAALKLFLADGFARTSVDAIAEEAGVSKRTIYNHYGDKETLFLSVIGDTYAAMIRATWQIMDAYLGAISDIDAELTAFAIDLAKTMINKPERAALIRLMVTEAPHFPELRSAHMRPLTITDGLAERLAVLGDQGLLDVPDPQEAAQHLFSLTFGQINNRSLFGTLRVSEPEIERMVTGGVRAFLRAYRPAHEPL
jgi:TetR/AcrR family transcriptional regulator, mexJK operon transcriptional repressor